MSIDATSILHRIADTLEARKGADPSSSYVAKLFSQGQDAILKKVGEESVESLLASKSKDRLHIVRETADLWFHCLVMLAHYGLHPQQVLTELQRRAGTSGLEEKAARNAAERERSERK